MGKSKITYLEDIGGRVCNPLAGCSGEIRGADGTIASGPCAHCWARSGCERHAANPSLCREGVNPYEGLVEDGRWTGEVRFLPWRLDELKRKKPTVFFMCPESDLLAAKGSARIKTLWEMSGNPQHTYLVLTKRPHQATGLISLTSPLANWWPGVTIWDDTSARRAIPHLRALRGAGWNTWVSYEPALGPVSRETWGELLPCVGWLVLGCESGPGARWMAPEEWEAAVGTALHGARACGVPAYYKQAPVWGSNGQVAERPACYGNHWLRRPAGWPRTWEG